MANNRIIYATKGIAFRKTGLGNDSRVLGLSASGVNPSGFWEVPRGVQSVSVTTSFNLENFFQQGQLNIYETTENQPDIEMTVNRVCDGSHPLYLMASDESGGRTTLNERNANYQCDIALHIYPDTNNHASGTPSSKMLASGMYLSSVNYTFPVDGPATEEITFVGNNKWWDTGNGGNAPASSFPDLGGIIVVDEDPTTFPAIPSAGITRREDMKLHGAGSTFPTDIPTNDRTKIQNITVSADLGREELFALGTKDPYVRVISFPLEVTCSFEVITAEGDLIEARADIDNLTSRTIIIKTAQGLQIDLGTANKLSSIDFTGGDTGGGEVTVTYTYTNNNDLTITHDYFS